MKNSTEITMLKFAYRTGLLSLGLGLLLGFSACTGPNPPDDNPLDPLSPNYTPTAPSRVYAYALSSSAVQIVWTDESLGELGFQIERKEAPGAFVEIGRTSVNDYRFTDYSSSLVSGHRYAYRLRPFTSNNYGRYSSEVSVLLP